MLNVNSGHIWLSNISWKKNVWFSEFFRVWNGREGIAGLYDHDNIKGLAYALSVTKGYYKCFMCIISLNFLE